MENYICRFEELGKGDTGCVGSEHASLGEMIKHLQPLGVSVPGGFATTTDAFREFLKADGLDKRINCALQGLDVRNIVQLTEAGTNIRQWIMDASFPGAFDEAIDNAYYQLQGGISEFSVAVRSSVIDAELPASLVGQQETYLNITGADRVKYLIKKIFSSLFSDRAISYCSHHGYQQSQIALSVGIQRMVRSDLASSGVMFTLDIKSGFRDVVHITAAYGLGESVVKGVVNPDEFYVHKPTFKNQRPAILRRNPGSKVTKIVYGPQDASGSAVQTVDVALAERLQFSVSDEEIYELTRQALLIEEHYRQPLNIEWAKDGSDGNLYIVQARPETLKNQPSATVMERYLLKESGKVICEGRSIGQRIGRGTVRIVRDTTAMEKVHHGDVLVANMTDVYWEPVMKRCSAIVTNRGGRTCHAAIIARELGIPAVVGCGDATKILKDGQQVTVSCAEGDTGVIYGGLLEFELRENSIESMPELPFKIMMNVGNPDRAFDFQALPNAGVGLARLEFIINRMIGVHPKALLNFDDLPRDIRQVVESRFSGYSGPVDFYVEKLVEGIATLAASFAPKKVIVRLSDFKSNEYANLIGGSIYEPQEENPMLGFRGASRYISDSFRDCFELECRALKKVRDEMGFTNVEIMVPFVRTVGEARQVVELLAKNGLKRGKNGLRVIMMCEIPANALLADQFLEYFDGFSIGSNDLTQLTLGLDRDSGIVAHLFDERNEAVLVLLSQAIKACRAAGKYIGISGQGPSDHPDFAKWLMVHGIGSVSLNPDSVLDTWFFLADKHT